MYRRLEADADLNATSIKRVRTAAKIAWLTSSAMCAIALAGTAHAQSGPVDAPDQKQTAEANDVVVVTGSRFGGRLVTESPVPIDSITGDELRNSGYTQLNDLLKVEVPSFSVPRPATAGSVDLYSAPSLRGLSPGQVLVLINGKRRHTTGDVSVHNQIGRGDVPYDLNAIPAAAIGRVEVLRDGAAAQYGADAIAGVINFSLDDSIGSGVSATAGVTDQGDGETLDLSGWIGVPIGQGGSLRTTLSYRQAEGTNRALPDTRQQYFGNNGASAISAVYGSGTGISPSSGTLDPREATIDRNTFRLGEPDYNQTALFVNAVVPLSEAMEFYAFGGASLLDGASLGFSRRAGQDETVRAIHPDGYTPILASELLNTSLATGVRGGDWLGFGYDLSTSYGQSAIDLSQAHSNNPSLGAASPTESYRGGIRFDQWTTNFDLTREFAVADGKPWKLALGLEHRQEFYNLVAGDNASYVNGGQVIVGGPNAGRPAPIGFQASAGIQPYEAGKHERKTSAAYAELEKEFGALLLSAAARFEDFSDFGDTTNYKLAARYQVFEPLALRASYNTGFRAPHLAQSFFSSTAATIINGAQVTTRILPVADPAARLIGSQDLKPEESKNISMGFVWDSGPFTLSVDAYQIKIEDRIALSSAFQDARITNYLASNGYPGISAVSYLTNAIDSTTEGVDVTATYVHELDAWGRLKATLAGNYNKQSLDRIAGTPAQLAALGIVTPLFDLTQQVRFTDSLPREKVALDLTWDIGDFSFGLSNVHYGEVSAVALTVTPAQAAVLLPGYDVELRPTAPAGANSQVIQTFGAKIITDLQATWRATDNLTLTGGVTNVFDVYPGKNIASKPGVNGSDNAGIFPYNYISPFGYNGRAFFVKAGYNF